MSRLAIVFGLGLWFAAAASAGPMPTAGASAPVSAPGQLDLFNVVFEGQGTLSGSSLSGLRVAGGTFVGTIRPSISASPVDAITVAVSNQPGFFAGSPLVGTMPVRGVYRITSFGGLTLIEVPLAVPEGTGPVTAGLGVGGTVMWTGEEDLAVTATFGPWSSGPVTIENVATPGGTGTLMRTGSVRVGPPAQVELVTPIRVVSTLVDPAGSFATLTYTLEAPEPGVPALLAVGSVVLAPAARRKLRSRPAC